MNSKNAKRQLLQIGKGARPSLESRALLSEADPSWHEKNHLSEDAQDAIRHTGSLCAEID
jgi:hypothetical protein